MKTINQLYQWCKANSTIAHIIGASILALSYLVVGLLLSFIISSIFFISKEFIDKNTTGFDYKDLAIDYVTWSITIIIIKIITYG